MPLPRIDTIYLHAQPAADAYLPRQTPLYTASEPDQSLLEEAIQLIEQYQTDTGCDKLQVFLQQHPIQDSAYYEAKYYEAECFIQHQRFAQALKALLRLNALPHLPLLLHQKVLVRRIDSSFFAHWFAPTLEIDPANYPDYDQKCNDAGNSLAINFQIHRYRPPILSKKRTGINQECVPEQGTDSTQGQGEIESQLRNACKEGDHRPGTRQKPIYNNEPIPIPLKPSFNLFQCICRDEAKNAPLRDVLAKETSDKVHSEKTCDASHSCNDPERNKSYGT